MTWPSREMAFGVIPYKQYKTCDEYADLSLLGRSQFEMYCNNAVMDGEYRWEHYGRELRIVSACNRYGDVLIAGPRHGSSIMTAMILHLGGLRRLIEYCGGDSEQGFIDQYGTFHSREEALMIARRNRQELYPEESRAGKLFSESLY